MQDDALIELLPKDVATRNQELLKIDMQQYNRPVPKFSTFAKDLRKIATKTLLVSYLSDVLNILPNQDTQKTTSISTSEKKLVNGRKTWSELVSAMHSNNLVDIEKLNVKQAVINRLASLGFHDTEKLYRRCVHALQENTAIVINFNASFLKNKHSADYHTQNIFERGHNNFSASFNNYHETREKTEYNLFK